MKAFLAVTDNDWFRFLAALPELDEVNFWQPSGGRAFRVLQPGEPLLFKLHHPDNFIAGGGFFAGHTVIPTSLAWESFAEKNGAPSLEVMRRRIERYRRTTRTQEDYLIGCILLEQPFFWEREKWLVPPRDFAPNVVQGKTYDLAQQPHGTRLWEEVQLRLLADAVQFPDVEAAAMFGEPTLVRSRLGQGTFRLLVTDAYERRCALTGEKILPVLQAAHIQPVTQGGQHRVDNGLLLRSDVHTLFDRGYLSLTPDLTLMVSRRLGDEFENGAFYYDLAGRAIRLPERADDRPDSDLLEWHRDVVFKAS